MPEGVRVTRIVIDDRALTDIVDGPEVSAEMDRRAGNVLRWQHAAVPVKTGALRASLKIVNEPHNRRLIGSFDVDYAADVELGYQHPGGGFRRAQPYIGPSIDAARQ